MEKSVFDAVLVDDAAEVRTVVRAQLRLAGRFNVVGEGESGREAVELATRLQPDVLLLDASMPDVDGLQAIPEILAAAPRTRVVMLTGFDGAELREKALALGAADFIEKSQPVDELPSRLLRLLQAGSAAAPEPRQRDEQPVSGVPEEVLAEHLERFRTVFEQGAIGMATLTLAGSMVRVNQALADFVGEPESQLVGRPYTDLVHVGDRQTIRHALAQAAVRGGLPAQIEHRMASGASVRWSKTTIATVTDSAGGPLYLFAQTEDITSRHLAVEELRQSEERFRLMVESVQDYAIFMLDPQGRVKTWNLGAQRLKGYRADEIVGRHFRTFYPRELQLSGHPEHELELAVRDGRYEEEGWRIRKDGSRFWANVVITALFDNDRRHVGFAKVTRDMTERREAQQQREHASALLEITNEELQAAARQTEEFVAVTAHELQSPLMAIGGAARLLEKYWDRLEPDERRDHLQRVLDGAARIRRLLSDLLAASRLDAGTFTVNLERVRVADAIDEAQKEVAGIIAPEVNGDEIGELAVLADRDRLVQILTNLLSNAAKYGAPPFSVSARQTDGNIDIEVQDAGLGVPEDLVPQLFTKFSQRSQPGRRGTGLGLFIVRELSRLHGGDASYRRAEHGGSAFVVTLPAAATDPEEVASAQG